MSNRVAPATSLSDLIALANLLVEAQFEEGAAEVQLKLAKARATRIREETIPGAMHELGLDRLQLSTGETLTIKQDVYASIPPEGKTTAFTWLEQHDFGGLIKTEVAVQYGRGDLDAAHKLQDDLRKQGLEAELSRDVHSQTLKAFLREQIRAGTDIPLDLFGALPVWVTKITTTRKK